MTVDFTSPVILMPDGSYVVAVKNPSYPEYNVTTDPEFSSMWQSIQDWLAVGNEPTPYIPPVPTKIDPEMQLRMEIDAEIAEEARAEKLKEPKWQARQAALEKQP